MVAPHGSPIQPSLYAVIKFCTASQPQTPLTNSDLSNIGVWSVQDIGKNGSNLNKGDSGDFCDLFTTDASYEYSEIGRTADVWWMKTSELVWKFGENWRENAWLGPWRVVNLKTCVLPLGNNPLVFGQEKSML